MRQIANNPGKVGNLAWSPDGKSIAFVSESTSTIHGKARAMTVVGRRRTFARPDRPPISRATSTAWPGSTTTRSASSPRWAARRRSIYSRASGGGAFELRFRRGAGIWKSFSSCGWPGTVWRSSGSRPRHPRVKSSPSSSGQEKDAAARLTNSNPSLAGVRFRESSEVVSYKARDGLKIEGLLITPADYERREALPPDRSGTRRAGVLLRQWLAHGLLDAGSGRGRPGATSCSTPTTAASTGRGVAFSKADQGRMAKEEFDDIVDGVDYLVARGLVDKSKVGITGGSYGGYASAWGATYYSKRFAASSVMFVGISEQISKGLHDGHPERELLLALAHATLRELADVPGSQPAVLDGERAQTPILIAHGKDDPRVSRQPEHLSSTELSRSRETFRLGSSSIRVRATAIERPPRNWTTRCGQMRWFDHYLKGTGKKLPPRRDRPLTLVAPCNKGRADHDSVSARRNSNMTRGDDRMERTMVANMAEPAPRIRRCWTHQDPHCRHRRQLPGWRCPNWSPSSSPGSSAPCWQSACIPSPIRRIRRSWLLDSSAARKRRRTFIPSDSATNAISGPSSSPCSSSPWGRCSRSMRAFHKFVDPSPIENPIWSFARARIRRCRRVIRTASGLGRIQPLAQGESRPPLQGFDGHQGPPLFPPVLFEDGAALLGFVDRGHRHRVELVAGRAPTGRGRFDPDRIAAGWSRGLSRAGRVTVSWSANRRQRRTSRGIREAVDRVTRPSTRSSS